MQAIIIGWICVFIGMWLGAWVGADVPEKYLVNLLGIADRQELGTPERNLANMLENTGFGIMVLLFAIGMFLVAVVGLGLTIFFLALALQIVLGLVLWILVTSKLYPKVSGLDFTEHFRAAMTGRHVTPTRNR